MQLLSLFDLIYLLKYIERIIAWPIKTIVITKAVSKVLGF